MEKVALLVPTKNRPFFLLRLIMYYSDLKSVHPIYIGDASENSNFKLIKDFCESNNIKANYIYEHLPLMNIRKTISYLGNLVKEDFVTINCDDDLYIPDSLSECAQFLKENTDYRTAQGDSFIYYLDRSGPYGNIVNMRRYWNRPNSESDSPTERLYELSDNYWVSQFSIHRKSEFIQDSFFYKDILDETFGELLHCYTFIAAGKSKYIDCLYLIRQDHNQRYLLPNSINWILNDKWQESLKLFIFSISEFLKSDVNIVNQGPQEIATDIFSKYLENNIRDEIINNHVQKKGIYDNFLDHFFAYLKILIKSILKIHQINYIYNYFNKNNINSNNILKEYRRRKEKEYFTLLNILSRKS